MSPEDETERDRPEDSVEHLRADMDETREEIDRTLAEIEARLDPNRMRTMVGDRLRDVTGRWRQRPGQQLEGLSREAMTRVREMAWMNPLGLGLAAAVVGYLLGRRTGSR